MKHNDFSPRLGLFIFIILALVAVAIGTVYPDRFPALEAFREWQDLTGGALALLAAIFAANYVKDQMAQTDRLDAAERARKLRAQRAVMPLALSAVIDFSIKSTREHKRCIAALAVPEGALPRDIDPPVLDVGFVLELKQMVELSDDVSEGYAALLSDLQVHATRWRGVVMNPQHVGHGPTFFEGEVIEAAEIYARASNLLSAARPQAEDVPPTTRMGALKLLGVYHHPRIEERAERLDRTMPLRAP